MEVNDELIEQWEPKINKILQDKWVIGMDQDDLAQEMRIVILKAAAGFKEDGGASFHTYLHRAMLNRIFTLITQSKRKLEPESLDEVISGQTELGSYVGLRFQEALAVAAEFPNLLELEDSLDISELTVNEALFLELKLEGLTMQEIADSLGEDSYRLRAILRRRLEHLREDWKAQ